MKGKIIRKTDFLIVGVAVIAALCLLYFQRAGDGHRIARVTVNSELVEEIDLDTQIEKTVIRPETDYDVVIIAENGEIYFESSSCRDKICVKTGRLSKKGDTAVCLPAKTVVSISGGEVDALTY